MYSRRLSQKEKAFEEAQEKLLAAWNSSTSLKPGDDLGRLGRAFRRKPGNKSNMSNNGNTIPSTRWNGNPNSGSHEYAMPSIRALRGLDGKNVLPQNGISRAAFNAAAAMYKDFDEYEMDDSPLCQFFTDPSRKNKRSTDNAPWPRLPIVTTIELARRRKFASVMYKKPSRKSRPTGFMDLLPHIRYKILNYIPTAERVKLQLVCRDIRDDIRLRVGIGMYVDENTQDGMCFMRDLMIDTVIVGDYRQPQLRPRELVFRWFDTLQIRFVGAISIPYMDSFVNRCRGVRKISVTGEIIERPPIPTDPERKKDYRSWRKVELVRKLPYTLHYCKLLELFPKGRQPTLTVKCALEVCHPVNIVKLKIVIGPPQNVEDTRTMYRAILKFIQDHRNLKDLWVDTKVLPFELPKTTRKECLIPERDLRTMSQKCKLRRLTVLEDNVNFYSWPCFLSEQEDLEVLQVLHCMLGSVYYSIIEANAFTLTKIAIHVILSFNYHDHDYDNQKTKYLNLSVFKNCHSLKKLYIRLSRSPKYPEGWWNNQLVNFIGLPGSLEVLALQNVTFFDGDFLDIVSKLKRLRSLGVVCPTESNQNMFCGRKFLGKIFWMRSLKELLLHGVFFIDRMIFEMDHLKQYFQPLTYTTGSVLYIRNKKATKSCHWKIAKKTKHVMEYKFEDPDTLYEV